MTRNSLHETLQPLQRGLGIIEIMIALALGVIIMLGVTQVATNNSSTRYELDRAGRQLENAVFALREIEADLTNAGYWGEMGEQLEGTFPPVCPTTACDRFNNPANWNSALLVVDGSPTACDLDRALHYPVQGGMARAGSEDFPCDTLDPDDLDGDSDADKITPKLATDYLAIRRANSCARGSAGCEAAGSNFHLQVNACSADGVVGAPLAGINYVIAPIVATPDLSIFRYKKRAESCAAADPAPQYRFLNRIYYISADDQLMRADLVWNVTHQYQQTALVEGVELMRFEYGLDTTDDGQVDAYTNAPTDAEWPDVVMVRVSLVVRSAAPSPGFTDDKRYTIGEETYCADENPKDFDNDPYSGSCDLDIPDALLDHRRQLYTRTVSLRNVAGRREGA